MTTNNRFGQFKSHFNSNINKLDWSFPRLARRMAIMLSSDVAIVALKSAIQTFTKK